MTALTLTFDILSYWHVGSGFGEGSRADAVVIKSPNGLPIVPGKEVKGLLRDAVLLLEDSGRVSSGTTVSLFGDRYPGEISRFDCNPGSLAFSDGTLGKKMEAWAETHPAEVQFLYTELSSTRIDESGLAMDKTLRTIEVTIPVKLMAIVESESSDDNWKDTIRSAAPLVRRLGKLRTRGLGRVQLAVEDRPE